MMKARLKKCVVRLFMLAACLPLSLAAAADHAGGRSAGGARASAHATHGGAGRAGTGGAHWNGGGWGWWGLGLGLGLGLDALYYGYPGYPYVPPVVIVDQPVVLAPPEGPAVALPPGPPATASWYYCASAQGYYPYVSQCPEPWQQVPAVPSGPVY